MTSITKCMALLCVSAVLLASWGANAETTDVNDANTVNFINALGASLGMKWDSSQSVCTYDGITCVYMESETLGHYMLYDINLPNRGLTGTLPDTDNRLFIRTVDLSHNPGITGTFPASWGVFVELTELNLSHTSLAGQIPHAWSYMTKLEIVDVSYTNACMGLPQWRSDTMENLVFVDFSHSYIYSVTDSGFSGLAPSSTLKTVNLDGNPLCGCFDYMWKSSDVLTAAAQSALPSGLAEDCMTNGGNDCPLVDTCLSTVLQTSVPSINDTGDSALFLSATVPAVLITAALAISMLSG